MVQASRIWTVEDNKLHARDVKVVREEGQYVIVEANLEQGTQIAVSVPDYPQDGMSVQIVGEFNTASVRAGE